MPWQFLERYKLILSGVQSVLSTLLVLPLQFLSDGDDSTQICILRLLSTGAWNIHCVWIYSLLEVQDFRIRPCFDMLGWARHKNKSHEMTVWRSVFFLAVVSLNYADMYVDWRRFQAVSHRKIEYPHYWTFMDSLVLDNVWQVSGTSKDWLSQIMRVPAISLHLQSSSHLYNWADHVKNIILTCWIRWMGRFQAQNGSMRCQARRILTFFCSQQCPWTWDLDSLRFVFVSFVVARIFKLGIWLTMPTPWLLVIAITVSVRTMGVLTGLTTVLGRYEAEKKCF